MRIPVNVRMAMTQIPIFNAHWKLLDHGAFSDFLETTIATAPTVTRASRTELAFAIPIAIEPAHIHQASGCSTRFNGGLLLGDKSGRCRYLSPALFGRIVTEGTDETRGFGANLHYL